MRSAATRANPRFPWLDEDEEYRFPDPEASGTDSVVAIGGNLSPGMLLSAYRQGIFPWFNQDDPIIWHSPDPRFVLPAAEVHISGTMKKILKKKRFALTIDRQFEDVIHACATTRRPRQNGTWITDDMEEAYIELHRLGWAHSIEAHLEGTDGPLVGGFYGVSIGAMFFGESMFSKEPDASKAVFIPFAMTLASLGFRLIDSQVYTDHVSSLGGREMARADYLTLLAEAVAMPGRKGSWTDLEQVASSV